MELKPATSAAPSAKKRAHRSSKKAAARKATKRTASGAGRTSKIAERTIVKLVKDNPRRKGTHGHRTFGLYRSGDKVSSVVKRGGRLVDVQYDLNKKFIRLGK